MPFFCLPARPDDTGEVPETNAQQLSLLPLMNSRTATPDVALTLLVGCWSLGRRLVRLRGRLVLAGAWLTFTARGRVVLSLRPPRQQQPLRTLGRWKVVGEELLVTINGATIRAPLALDGEVMRWAGEVLVRQHVKGSGAEPPRRASSAITADDASFVSGSVGGAGRFGPATAAAG